VKLQVTGPALPPAVSTKDCAVSELSGKVSVAGLAVTPLVQTIASVTPPVPAVGASPGVTGIEVDACSLYSVAGRVTVKSARGATVNPVISASVKCAASFPGCTVRLHCTGPVVLPAVSVSSCGAALESWNQNKTG